jgi:hypothetical protein
MRRVMRTGLGLVLTAIALGVAPSGLRRAEILTRVNGREMRSSLFPTSDGYTRIPMFLLLVTESTQLGIETSADLRCYNRAALECVSHRAACRRSPRLHGSSLTEWLVTVRRRLRKCLFSTARNAQLRTTRRNDTPRIFDGRFHAFSSGFPYRVLVEGEFLRELSFELCNQVRGVGFGVLLARLCSRAVVLQQAHRGRCD